MGTAAFTLALLATAPGGAEGPRTLAVFPVVEGGTTFRPADVREAVAKAVRGRTDLELRSPESLFRNEPGPVIAGLKDCGDNQECLAAALRNADLGLLVTVNLRFNPPLLSVRLVDRDQHRITEQRVGHLELHESSLTRAIELRAKSIFDRAGYPVQGSIIVDVLPSETSIELHGGVLDTPRYRTYFVSPGRYRLIAKCPGCVSQEHELEVEAGQEHYVAFRMEKAVSLLDQPSFWAFVGSTVLLGVTVAALAASSRDTTVLRLLPP